MIMRTNTIGNDRGSLMVVVLMTGFVLAVLSAAVFYVTNTELAESGLRNREIKAFHLAESGLEHTMLWLSTQSTPPEGTDPFNPMSVRNLEYGTYDVTVTPDSANPSSVLKRYTISSIGETGVGDVQQRIEIDVRQESFAKYGLFFDQSIMWTGSAWKNVWFTDYDTVRGPCHGNDYIRFVGDAHFFEGLVTSTQCNFVYNSGTENPYFEEGYRLGVDPITMPADTEKLKLKAAETGWSLNGNTTIKFNPDGTMNIRNPNILGDDGVLGHLKRNVPIPPEGVLHVEAGDIDSLTGVFHGALTVSCSQDIYVTDHIDYKDDPRLVPSSTDVLGIVAENKVVIPEGTPDELRMSATIMALHAIEVVNCKTRPRQGNLHTLGGWIVHYLYATEGSNTGYGTDTVYDNRLADMPPPWFPTIGTYAIVAWREM